MHHPPYFPGRQHRTSVLGEDSSVDRYDVRFEAWNFLGGTEQVLLHAIQVGILICSPFGRLCGVARGVQLVEGGSLHKHVSPRY